MSNKKELNRRVQIQGVDGVKRNLTMQDATRKDSVQNYKKKLKSLVMAKRLHDELPDQEMVWIGKQNNSTKRHLVKLGIIDNPNTTEEVQEELPTINDFVGQMISVESRKTTRRKLILTREMLNNFFTKKDEQGKLITDGKLKRIDEVTKGDANRFRKHMIDKENGLGLDERSTARRYIGYCKQIWNSAIEDELVTKNPFRQKKLPSQVKSNEEKQFYIDKKLSQRLYEVIPEGDYRLRFVLMRYAGLRSPSELNALQWCDIDFGKQEMTIRSPKLAHCDNKGIRTMPIPTPVLFELNKAWVRAGEGVIKVLPRISHHTLTKTVKRWIKKINVECWPALLNNFRRSAVTDAHNGGMPSHILDTYFGHSEGVSKACYRMAEESAKQKFLDMKANLEQDAEKTNKPSPNPRERETN